ncbi:MAG TPA: hypothetical protein VFY50_02445, partial [Candidatus Nitrosocosmicus sp.]|nr:hypothetical protein [Candidatus Nitrosocosmicus sp.]
LKIQSITTEGYFIILRLYDTSLIVNAIDILRKVYGVLFIFVGVAVKPDYDSIVNTIIKIYSNKLIDGTTYFLKIKSATLSLETEKSDLDHFDLEFHLNSELSASFNRSIQLKNATKADVIIYILLSLNISYISLLVFQGKPIMPLNYLQNKVICPIFDNISIISFIKAINSGFTSIPLFFFKGRNELRSLLKAFENIITAYPINLIDIYLISIEDHMAELIQNISANDTKRRPTKLESQSFHWPIFCLSILKIMEEADLDIKTVAIPLTAYVHPRWLIKETIEVFQKSGINVLTPLLFNYTSQDFETDVIELTKQGLGFDPQVVNLGQIPESDQEEFRKLLKDISIHSFQSNSKYVKKITLRVREDDILDIFNSI